MERKKFYTIIDQYALDWYIDANKPVKGIWGSSIHDKTTGPRRKTNYKGEENPINETSGEVQILKWAKKAEFCTTCSKFCEDKVELINLEKCQIKCSCGIKFPICLDKTRVNSK
jgi:hypothetical protein